MNTSTMNTLAVGFAAFAAWYVLKPKAAQTAPSGPTAAEQLFGLAAIQRREVGVATAMNNLFANGITQAADYSSQYAKRQGVPSQSVDVLGHTADYYNFAPSYLLA